MALQCSLGDVWLSCSKCLAALHSNKKSYILKSSGCYCDLNVCDVKLCEGDAFEILGRGNYSYVCKKNNINNIHKKTETSL